MLVHTRNPRELLAVPGYELFAAANPDFFDRLQTVRDERRTDHKHPFFSFRRQPRQFVVRVRFQNSFLTFDSDNETTKSYIQWTEIITRKKI